jgi:hypothetical protein
MLPFDTLFMDLAGKEVRVIHSVNSPDLPLGTYIFREFFCGESGCDCRRVILHVVRVERRQTVASINYSFEPAQPPFDDEPQVFLDPLNPQSQHSEVFRVLFENMITSDRGYHDRLVRHYQMWKRVIDDPLHPDHSKIRSV